MNVWTNTENLADSNEITRRYLDSLLTETRYIDSVIPDLTFSLYGEVFVSPIMTSAFSHLGKLDPGNENGMVEMARGAYAAGAVMWAGMGDDQEITDMAATGARIVKIIKPYAEETLIFHQIKAAEENNAVAVGMDIDHFFDKKGNFDHVLGSPMRAKTLENLKRYISSTRLPFIIKGVLSVRDARKCVEAGAKGIVVSHHHGICDYCVPPLMILPAIAEAVNKRIPIFADCGISRGFDAFKALALGADGVCVGRTIIQDLKNGGYMGVKKKLDEMNDELRSVMARTASPDVRHIAKSVVWNQSDS